MRNINLAPTALEPRINTLDDPDADDESEIYLTVTGPSAEDGDDRQVDRGNRVNGLITPSRWMPLETASWKISVCHVCKIYNVLAGAIANEVVTQVGVIDEVATQLLPVIGLPTDRPQLVAVQVTGMSQLLNVSTARQVHDIAFGRLDAMHVMWK